MNLSSVIASLATGTYTVTRYGNSAYVNGRKSAPSSSTFTILACVQPVTGRELQRLPEAFRDAEVKALWTATALIPGALSNNPDSIVIGGEVYQVQTVERWAESGAYWKALVSKFGH